jgi:hypothetical protein
MPNVFYNVPAGPASGLPIINSATPPTAAQAAQIQEIIVQVGMVLADTQALVTHNWGLSASQAGNFFYPQIMGPIWQLGPLGGGSSSPFISFDVSNTNVVKVNKLGVAGTEGSFILHLRRPFSASA